MKKIQHIKTENLKRLKSLQQRLFFINNHVFFAVIVFLRNF